MNVTDVYTLVTVMYKKGEKFYSAVLKMHMADLVIKRLFIYFRLMIL